jgi:hypothetical protein
MKLEHMSNFYLSTHARNMLIERNISEEWLWSTLLNPDEVIRGSDGNNHYQKSIPERGSRVLHVVVNDQVQPNLIVTVFFDRRLRKNETKT